MSCDEVIWMAIYKEDFKFPSPAVSLTKYSCSNMFPGTNVSSMELWGLSSSSPPVNTGLTQSARTEIFEDFSICFGRIRLN